MGGQTLGTDERPGWFSRSSLSWWFETVVFGVVMGVEDEDGRGTTGHPVSLHRETEATWWRRKYPQFVGLVEVRRFYWGEVQGGKTVSEGGIACRQSGGRGLCLGDTHPVVRGTGRGGRSGDESGHRSGARVAPIREY